MNVKAYLDQGLWASELEKLARHTGKTIEETMRAQARLLVADCILLTPPAEAKGRVPTGRMSGRFKQQYELGKRAIVRDVMKVFVPQASRKIFSLTGRAANDKVAHQLAKLAAARNVDGINRTLIALNYGKKATFKEVQLGAHRDEMKPRRVNGRINARNNRVLIHNGVAKAYEPGFRSSLGYRLDHSTSALVDELLDRMGRAKGGWAPAAKALKLALPQWIRKHRKRGEGFVKIEGASSKGYGPGGLKLAITVASTVPYMQGPGATLEIIRRAWQRRLKNLQLQRQITEHGKGKGRLFIWRASQDQDKAI